MNSETLVAPTDFPEQEKPSPRERIYQAALACFARQGVRSTNMEAVAREAGVSRPSIYYYFKDKQSLIVEAVLRQHGEAIERRAEHISKLHGLEAVLNAVTLGIEGAMQSPYIEMLTGPESERLTTIALHSKMARDFQSKYWSPLLDDARRRGELRDDIGDEEIVTWIIFLQYQIVVHGRLIGCVDRESIRNAIEKFLAPVLHASAYRPPAHSLLKKAVGSRKGKATKN